ncbi:hypothetical protein GCM10011386_33710 [Parapedobacter defluvii]|uniref:Glycosyl transferases group 1 n=2 Tax=Parapedobacter defluvii TaxID=2045106 RepID=A0ABQ1MFI1_9SPHI|nr:hypothetical protein GCM10011386_33710 [Parapedobacter defluvii]
MPRLDLHVSTIIAKKFNYINIPMGYDDSFYNLDPTQSIKKVDQPILERVKHKIGQYKFTVAYAGTIGKANRVEDLLLAVQYLPPDTGIFIIGKGPLKDELVESYAENVNIHFFEPVSKESLPRVLSNFDILVNMWDDKNIYRFGVSPNKWIDYMLSSRPILVSFNGYQSIINDSGCGWFIKAKDPKLLASKIEEIRLEYTPEELSDIGKLGFDYVIKELNYKSLTKKISENLDSLQKR